MIPARKPEGARPSSVEAVVGAVHAGLRAARAVECALLALAGVWLARAAAVVSGADGRACWVACALCGLLAAATWWLEHPLERGATARTIDRRLRFHDALTTAHELERRAGARTPLEELVRARVLARLRFGEAMAALLPPLVVPVGAPLATGVLLLLALDGRRAPPDEGLALAPLARGLERALVLPEVSAEAEDDPRAALALRRVQAEARSLAASLAQPPADPERAAEARAQLEALDRELCAELARTAPEEPRRASLEEARAWLDGLRAGLAPKGPDGPDLTAGAANGTISRPSGAPTEMPPALPTTASSAEGEAAATAQAGAAAGVQAGNAWEPENDALVERWLELTRAARAAASR